LYQAYNHGGGYVNNDRAIVGGDFNARLDAGAYNYTFYTAPFGPLGGFDGGANCNDGALPVPNPNIRANNPAPIMPPAFPPLIGWATPADNPTNKSSIQLRHPIIPPPGGVSQQVLSNNTDHYRRLAIDNIFYRGFNAINAPHHTFVETILGVQQTFDADIYDLLKAVSNHIPPGAVPVVGGPFPNNFFIPPATITPFQFLPIFGLAGFLVGVGGPVPMGLLGILDPLRVFHDIQAGVFVTPLLPAVDPPAPLLPAGYAGVVPIPATVTPVRRSAEFVKKFISDHLPVIFRMN
jgi:hypothetical protein